MTITSEDAVNSMISDQIESESVTDATASARMIVVSVDDESARNKQPGLPDEGEEPCEEPPAEEPEPDGPNPDDHI